VAYAIPETGTRPGTARAVAAGGAGFLGSHPCEALLNAGTPMVRLDFAWFARQLASASAA
jgi:hypothetical protein